MGELKKILKEHFDVFEKIFNTIKVGIFIIDDKGKVLHVNEASAKTGGLKREELIGRSMYDLTKEGYVEVSSSLLTLKSGKEESLVQTLGDGGKIFISSVPLTDNDQIDIVICTERDVTETMQLRDLLFEKQKITEEYEKELRELKKRTRANDDEMIAESFAMKNVLNDAIRVAASDMTVLLTGESGTGKELVANYIYQNSKRVGKPFYKINCAAMPESLIESELFGYEKGSFTGAEQKGKSGIFELADEGTLFLDEITELSFNTQAKLLRVLQENEIMRIGGGKIIKVDVRIIAATNKDLHFEVDNGRFRNDLYYRLNVFPINTPPLRKRKEDIKKLAIYFLTVLNRKYKMNKWITEEGLNVLKDHDWPGNVRELRNIIERIMIGSDRGLIGEFQIRNQIKKIEQKDVYIDETELETSDRSLTQMVFDYEADVIRSLLDKGYNISQIAGILKVNKSTISRKIRKYDTM